MTATIRINQIGKINQNSILNFHNSCSAISLKKVASTDRKSLVKTASVVQTPKRQRKAPVVTGNISVNNTAKMRKSLEFCNLVNKAFSQQRYAPTKGFHVYDSHTSNEKVLYLPKYFLSCSGRESPEVLKRELIRTCLSLGLNGMYGSFRYKQRMEKHGNLFYATYRCSFRPCLIGVETANGKSLSSIEKNTAKQIEQAYLRQSATDKKQLLKQRIERISPWALQFPMLYLTEHPTAIFGLLALMVSLLFWAHLREFMRNKSIDVRLTYF